MEREKRARTIIIKGIKGEKEGKGELEKRVEQILKRLKVEVKVVEIKRLERGRREWGETVMVKVRSAEEERKVIKNKKKLKGGNFG